MNIHHEDGGSKVLQNVDILLHYYLVSQPRRLQLEFFKNQCAPRRWRQHSLPKHWYPTKSLHGITTQKTMTSLLWRP